MGEEISVADSLPDGRLPLTRLSVPDYQSYDISNGGVIDYWGYAGFLLSCTNSPGSCGCLVVVVVVGVGSAPPRPRPRRVMVRGEARRGRRPGPGRRRRVDD
ncbi:hypothetical protein LZ31DRAFT_162221 [Colletotrichum somersetense]|nr:hypothetical protein LZ31DRAFT_162221 [Colletotrichum somersetense]